MDENELYEVLGSYKQALDLLNDKIDQLEETNKNLTEQVSDLENTLYDRILAPAQAAMDEADYNDRLSDFSDKYGEKLNPFTDSTKAINGDDYDFTKEAFDNYENMEVPEGEEKPDMDTFVDTLVAKTEETLNSIKEKLGADKVEAEVTEDGDVSVKVDGEEVTEEAPMEGIPVEATGEKEEEEGEEEEDSPEDVAELEKELEEEAKKYKE